MVKKTIVFASLMLAFGVNAQEMLCPIGHTTPSHSALKPNHQAITLPFFDDFSNYSGAPTPNLWTDDMATVNVGYGLYPPTVGLLTLDALDAEGQLYHNASTELFPADTVTSRPIRLDGLSLSDSIVLSFYYLPGGGEGNMWERVGDTPEPNDSLFLEVYSAPIGHWTTIWSRGGVSIDTLLQHTGLRWQYVAIALSDERLLDSTFRFRFRNYCSLDENSKPGIVGNCDQWNIDYVMLDKGRSTNPIPEFRDVAFSMPAPSMLTHYTAMPAKQYRTSDMAERLSITIANLYSSELASEYAYSIFDANGRTLYTYHGGYENAPSFLPGGHFQTATAHATPHVSFSFPESNSPHEYTIVHTIREGVGGDIYPSNDTVIRHHRFDNYFAYDDGTPENGYGLTSTASRLYLAYRFDLHQPDTLTAVDLYFNRTYDGRNEQIPFFISVWSCRGGFPDQLLYRDQERRLPHFEGDNQYCRYILEQPIVVSDSIFVGFEQTNNYYINLGFDRSNNTADRICYLTGTQWQQSILSGSLMLRPYFGNAATVDIHSPIAQHSTITLYPNPTSHQLQISGLQPGSSILIYDARGALTLQSSPHSEHSSIDVTNWPDGIYILKVSTPTNTLPSIHKIVIRH